MLTIPEIINIGKGSSVLASIDVLESALFGRKLDPRLPLMIQVETSTLEMRYLKAPTDITLIGTANYVLELCGNYAATAQTLIAGGGGTVITPVAPNGYIYVSLVFTVIDNIVLGIPNNGATVWTNPDFIDAQQLTYLIIDNTIETLNNGFTLDTGIGTIARNIPFFTGSVISISFMKKV